MKIFSKMVATIALLVGSLAQAAPLTVTPSTLNFGNQLVGTASAVQTVSVKNTSGFTLSGAIGFTNPDFQYAGGTCGASLANNATCTISIVFVPSAYGPVAGALTFGPYTAATLSGTGTGLPAASLSATSLTFGNQLLNTASTTSKSVTLSNFSASGATLSIASITASGDFSQTNNCGTSLLAGASCTINVTVTPTLLGMRSGSLSVASDAPGSPHSVALSGMGRTVGTVAAGLTHSAALKTDGSVWAWGWNADGDGTGTIAERYAPVQVMAAGSGAVALASGGSHTLVLKANGSVWAWGNNAYGQLGDGTLTSRSAPVQVMAAPGVPLSGVVAVAAGQWYSVALKADGTVVAWGNNNAGQLGDSTNTARSTPVQVLASAGVPLNGVVALAAGQMHTMALKSDGTVVAWGYNGSGQLGDGTTTTPRYLPVPVMASPGVPLTGVTSIAAGLIHSMALKSDGTLWAWGSDLYGQLGVGWGTDKTAPVQVMLPGAIPMTGVVAMGSGSMAMHSFALKSDGSLWGWGYTDDGEVGNGVYGWSALGTSHPVQVIGNPAQVMAAGSGVVSMTGGQYHSVVIKSDNSVWAWGKNTLGRLGDGTVVSGYVPPTATPVSANFNSPAVTLSTAALNFSQILNTASPAQTVRLANPGSAVLNVSSLSLTGIDYAQTNNCPAGTGGNVIALGSGAYCDISVVFTPAATGARNGSLAITSNAMGSPHSITLTGTGLPPLVGMQPSQMVFPAQIVNTSSAVQTMTLTNNSASTVTLSSIVASGNFTQTNTCSAPLAVGASCTVSVTFTPTAVGERIGGLTITSNAPSSPHNMVLAGAGRIGGIGIGAGMFHSVALKPDGSVEAWGRNVEGQLGDGTTTYRPSPVTVLNGAVRLAVGANHALALKSDGSLWAWGSNTSGQLGDNTATQRNSPVQIMAAGSGVVDIVAGSSHSLALKSDGSVWAWGWNTYGALGDNTTAQRNAPVQIMAAGSGVVQLAAGANHTLALKSDGTVWAWGDNYYGELGIGSAGLGANSSPILLTTSPGVALSGVVALAAGGSHTLALKSDGSVWAWGYNLYGQLGDNTTAVQRNSPVQVMAAGSGVVALTAGESQSLAFKSDGSVWAWGRNNQGQLGDGTGSQRNSPVQVMAAGSGVVALASGSFHSLAFKSDISVLAWGDNSAGQLGDGTTTQHLTPTASNFNVAIPVYSRYPSISFAGQLLGVTGTSSVTLSNTGTIALNITSLAASGDFSQTNNCGSSLASGASCSISLSFTPTAAGMRNGALTLVSNALNSPYAVSLSGEGLAPVAHFSPASLDFGTQNLGSSSAVQTVALDNIAGTAPLHIASISASGDFVQANNCPSILNQGSSCTISVTFTPTTGGARNGVLTVASDAPGSPHALALTGVGQPVPLAGFSSTSLSFGTRNVGTSSAAQSITLTNSGTAVLNMTSVGLSGTNAGDFSLSNGCGATLAIGASCTISVSMIPGAAGLRTASITIASDAVGNPHNLPLAGIGRQGSVAAGRYHSLVLKPNGSVWAWGNNQSGELGDGTGISRILPVQAMAPGSGVIQLAAGINHSLALKSDGSVWAWGMNSSGELGDGTSTQRYSPVQVMVSPGVPLSGVIELAAGSNHSLALKSDGSVWAWGSNSSGQIGDGTTIWKNTLVQVLPAGSGVVALAAGAAHSLVLKSDGSVWAWGLNGYGQLGDGTGANKTAPVQVMGPGSGVAQLVAGLYDSLALKSDGSVWGWGSNVNGSLGMPFSVYNYSPVQSIAPGGGVVSLASGSNANHTLLLKSDGSVWATGHNFYGQLGIGTSGAGTDQFAPVQVIAAGSGAVALTGNEQHSLLLKSDGSLAAWGSNGSGQLGDGSTTQRLAPTAANFNWAWANLSATGLNFIQALGGGTTAAQNVTLTNTGLVMLNISGIAVSGSFNQSNNCGASLAPGAACTVNVTFTPNAVGAHSGSLTINSDSASGAQQNVILSGNGTAAVATLTSTTLNFGNQALNTVGYAQWVMLSNTGNVTMNIGGISASGDFMQVSTCGATLAPNASCYIFPLFIPSAVGARSGTVTIVSDAYQHPHTIALSGTGAVPAFSLSATTLNFANQVMSRSSTSQTVTLTNNGSVPVSITSITPSGDFAQVNGCGASVAVGATCTVSVTFTPTAAGGRTGTLTIASNAAGGPHTVALSGKGVAARYDFDGDGKSDILWHNGTTGQGVIWKSASPLTSQAMATLPNLAWGVAGIGDFDGDGKVDVLWRNGSTGQNTIWKSGNAATSQAVTTLADLAWQIVGSGDFDGDGKADILWRHGITGQNMIWKSASSAALQAVTTVSSSTWSVAGIGDFDGDGKADILWRNSTTGANTIWKSGNAATPQAVATVTGTVWQIAGIGDFDGDGKADILWRNGTTGANTIWRSGNAATSQAVAAVSGTAWAVKGTGDYNGDGKADILWRNSTTGTNTIWRSGNAATSQAVPAVAGTAWQVQ